MPWEYLVLLGRINKSKAAVKRDVLFAAAF